MTGTGTTNTTTDNSTSISNSNSTNIEALEIGRYYNIDHVVYIDMLENYEYDSDDTDTESATFTLLNSIEGPLTITARVIAIDAARGAVTIEDVSTPAETYTLAIADYYFTETESP